MKQTRKKYLPEFKAKVAIEALKNQETLSQLSEKYKVSSVMISRWKSEFLANAAAAFGSEESKDKNSEKELKECYEKIGRLEMKLDFAKRVSQQLGIPMPADD